MDMSDPETAAMAAAMGFSSFGAQENPTKRRKFNPSADAVVASTTSTLPLHHGQPSGQASASGSNAAPLGSRSANQDEIDLDLDDDDDDDDENEPAPTAESDQPDTDPAPQYIDTSQPPTAGDALAQTEQVAATLHQSSMLPPTLPPHQPPRHFQGHGGAQGPDRRRARDNGKPWFEDYYDPSSIVNPWERLEQNLSLGPTEKWMTWEQAKIKTEA